MKKGIVIVFLAFSAWGMAETSSAQAPVTVDAALQSLTQETKALWEQARTTAYRYPQGKDQVTWEIEQRPVKWYQNHLYDIMVVEETRAYDPEGRPLPKTRVVFSRWSRILSELTSSLNQAWRKNASVSDLKDQFFALHTAYVRTLVSTNVLIEALNRQHLYQDAPNPMTTYYRADLSDRLYDLRNRMQRIMQWMHYIREGYQFEVFTQSIYFQNEKCWECTYGKNFHYNEQQPSNERLDLGNYFLPYGSPTVTPPTTTTPPVTNQDPSTNRAAWQKEYDEIQKLMETNAEARTDERLRTRLSELQQLLSTTPPTTTPPTTTTPPAANENNGGTPPTTTTPMEEPSTVKDNEKVQQLVLRLQNLLSQEAVKNNPELSKNLQGFLDELRPGRPPLKPLPPKNGTEQQPTPPKQQGEKGDLDA